VPAARLTLSAKARQSANETKQKDKAMPGLYENINKKRKRIAGGSGEKMREAGSKGAPSAKDFKDSAKTAKKSIMGKGRKY